MKKNTQCLLSISEATISTRLPNPRISRSTTLKLLIAISLVVAFSQITLGGIVRASESGLGCPDWPLCHGQIIPPLDLHTLIEYSHRLTGTVVGILIIALLLMTFYYRKKDSLLMKSAFASFLLVILAGLLGGAVVVTELEWWIRLVHLSIAQALIATLVVMLWRISSTMVIPPIDSVISTNDKKLWQWTLFGLITLTFITLISGSFMVGMGSSASCTTWPLCGGKFGFPYDCLLYTSPSPRDATLSRMPSSA